MLSVLYLMIPLALVFVAVAVGIFVMAVRSGQFEDLEGPAHRILEDDKPPDKSPSSNDDSADK